MTPRETILRRARARQQISDAPAIVRALRQRAKITQREVGEVLGVSSVAVSRWESGDRLPSGDLAAQLLELLHDACGDGQ